MERSEGTRMADGAFLDPASPPTRRALVEALGEGISTWDRLVGWMDATYGIDGEPIHFGRESGWSLRVRRSARALLTLTPMADGSVRALVVIGPSAWDAVAGEPLSPTVRAAWGSAHPYPDGRWLWLPLTDGAVIADVERLVALKSPPPRRPRPRPAPKVPPVTTGR
jgi:hypothetical protein